MFAVLSRLEVVEGLQISSEATSKMPSRDELVKGAAKVSPDQAHNAANPKVYFDIKIGDPHAGRVTFEVIK